MRLNKFYVASKIKKELEEEIRILKEANRILEEECKRLRAAMRVAKSVIEEEL
jgi:hypothetical protein